MDKYAKYFVGLMKAAKTDKEREGIVNKVYEDGFSDGVASEQEENKDPDELMR